MNTTYRDFHYPVNLLIEIFGFRRLPDYDADSFHDVLNQALNTLPEQVKAAVILRYERQMTYREIAAALDRSVSTSGNLVNKGIRLLRHPDRASMLSGKSLQ